MCFPRTVLVIAACFWTLTIRSQDLTFLNYSKSHGLGAQLVDITQDANDNFWMIGLLGQFYSHDGIETKSYSFPEHLFTNSIFRIAVDRTNTIWLLTDRGLISFDGETYSLLTLPVGIKPDYESQLVIDANNRIWIRDRWGTIGYTGAQGITLFDHKAILSDAAVNFLTIDEHQQVWLASIDGQLLNINENVNSKRIILDELKGKKIECMDFFNGKLTVVASDSLYIFKNLKLVEKQSLHLEGQRIRQVLSDKQSNTWVFSEGKLWRVTPDAKLLINESYGLTNNRITRIFRDTRKSLWVLTDAKGTFASSVQPFHQTIVEDEPIVSSVLQLENKQVLFGTYGKGLFFKNSVGSVVKINTGSEMDRALILGIKKISTSDYLVASNGAGLFRVHSDPSFTRVAVHKPSQPDDVKYTRTMGVFGDSILCGTKVGLVLSSGDSWKVLTNPMQLVVNCFYRITPTKILVGSTEGLFLLEDSKLTQIDSAGLRSTAINTIRKDAAGNYWVGSNRKEVLVYDKHLHQLKKINLPVQYDGVFLIEFIDSQNAFVGLGSQSANAIGIKFSNYYDIISHTVYGPSHGWPDPGLVLGASTSLRDGSIWIGTSAGAFRFNPYIQQSDETAPRAYLRKIAPLNSEVDVYSFAKSKSGFYKIPEGLILPHDANSLALGFRASDISSPRSLLYRFRLNGLTEKWSDWTSQDEVIYSNLRPGKYSFEVQAINDRGIAGKTAVYSFSVAAAFWQTWWFYLIVLGALLVLLFMLNRVSYRLKLRDYKKQEEVKKNEAIRIKQQMSMDFHDELGNKLAGVMSYSSALRHSSKNQELDKALEYIETTAQEIFNRTRDFIWAIDVESHNLLQVLIYLRDFGVKFFERNHISFDIKTKLDPEIFDHALPEGYNRQIILIFKEAMTNILKHANSKHVDFSASISHNGWVRIVIEDDGMGITSPMNSGSGLKNMKKRAGGINGAFELNKSDLGGLRISLEFQIDRIDKQ